MGIHSSRLRGEFGRRGRSLVTMAAFVAVSIAYFCTIGNASFQPKTFEYDLVPFYCGGVVVAAHHDPYRVEPLRSCEHAVGPVFRKGTQLVVPDPLPAYDQAAMAIVARFPYPVVQWVWFALEIGSCAASALLLARLCRLPLATVAATLVVSDLFSSTVLGQVAAFSTFGLVLTGWSLVNDRRALLAVGLGLALIEPHLGLAALVAVALWNSSSRTVALLVAAFLGTVSLLALPVPVLVEYFTRVIPAHALSEINNQDQLSSAYAFHAVGVGEATSEMLAKVNYVLMLVLGVALSKRATDRFGAAVLPFGATAFVLLGGPFLHATQLPAALPAALLVVGRARSRLAGSAATLLTIPWVNFAPLLTVLPVAAGALYVALRRLCAIGARSSVVLAGLAIGAETCIAFCLSRPASARVVPEYGRILSSDLAEVTWRTIIDLQQHDHVVLAALGKLPTELALIAIIFVVARESFDRRVGAATVTPTFASL